MEVLLNKRRATTRPIAWVAALLAALAFGLIGLHALRIQPPAHATGGVISPVTSSESSRRGGPGGQIADASQPVETARSGGPGGQVGDAP
jgi:hypothetical protein